MNSYAVVKCAPNELVFLFTYRLGPCMAVAAVCRSQNDIVLGLGHFYRVLDSADFPTLDRDDSDRVIDLGYRRERVDSVTLQRMLEKFHPYQLNGLIDLVKQNAHRDDHGYIYDPQSKMIQKKSEILEFTLPKITNSLW